MKRGLGRLIWSQSRDIKVLNYPHHFVYDIWTNHGLLRIAQEKDTKSLFKVDEVFTSSISPQISKFQCDKKEEIFIPTLK